MHLKALDLPTHSNNSQVENPIPTYLKQFRTRTRTLINAVILLDSATVVDRFVKVQFRRVLLHNSSSKIQLILVSYEVTALVIHSNVSYLDAGDTGTPLYQAAPAHEKFVRSHYLCGK